VLSRDQSWNALSASMEMGDRGLHKASMSRWEARGTDGERRPWQSHGWRCPLRLCERMRNRALRQRRSSMGQYLFHDLGISRSRRA